MNQKIMSQNSNQTHHNFTSKNIIYNNINTMYKQDLSNLTKDQLIDLLLKQNTKIQLLKNKLDRPTPAQRRNVKQMVQDYEENIIPPPQNFKINPSPSPEQSRDLFHSLEKM